MKRLRALIPLLLSSVALPANAQIAAPATSGFIPAALASTRPVGTEAPAASAVTTLVRQAERWLAQSRPDLAQLAASRALAADPTNIEALLIAARIETARNNRDGAIGFLRRATAAGGTEEQRSSAAAALRSVSLDQSALEQARRLAQDGRADESAARYRALFGQAGPTPEYAREYYQALAGSAGTRAEGVRGLGRLADAPAADDTTKLASATALTYLEATRADGISRLTALADRPDTAAAAQQAWRQAVGFLGNDPSAAPQIEAYLKRFPNDPELVQRLEVAKRAPVASAAATRADTLRREGFAQLETGALRPSADRFTAALATNPADADALGGLGLVRLRENKPDEARPLLERAIAADPARGAQWQKALDGAVYGSALTEARAALRKGDPAAADLVLRDALRRDVPDKTDAETMLGEVALARGDAAGAEQRFRAALSRRANFPPAANGLNQALRAQGKLAEAPARPAVVATAPAEYQTSAPTAPSVAPPPANGRVAQLQAEAAQTSDVGVSVTLLRSAVALAPSDPWPRLDLARALKRQGRNPEARALVEELAARANTPDSHFAAALLAQEDGRLDDADAQLGAITPQRRTADMSRLQARVRTDRDVTHAAFGALDSGVGRQNLMAIATRPDPSGSTGASVIRAFGAAGDRKGAIEASRVALAANAGSGATARLAIAGALLSADADAEATALADQFTPATLNGEQRRDLASLRSGIAIRASDRLNESGAQAQAFEKLRPVLAQDPENAEGQLALARLYQGARKPADAMALAQSVLARDPRNFAARQGAVDAAIALGDRKGAQTMLAEAEAIGPNDSRLTYLQARVANSFGNTSRAQNLLQQSLQQRQAELGTDALAPNANDLSNPFLRGSAGASVAIAASTTDPLSRQIVRDLKSTEVGNAPQVSFAPTVHTRSGSPGLDQLTAIGGSIEGSVAAPTIGGTLIVKAEPVLLNGGQIGSTPTTLYRFGTNPLLGSSPITPKNVSTTGVGLGVGYALRDVFKLSAGTSPLGFKMPNLIGGFEIAPRITDTLRLRFTADRHAMTDSQLSWAGLTDPSSRITWGGVTSSGGRGQIEGPMGKGSFYAGGGYAVLNGSHVAANNRTEAGLGFSYPIFRETDGDLTAGVDLVYFGFANNQRAYTVGNGGYFSPQSYGAVNLPLDYHGKSGDLDYRVGLSVGYATFRESSSPVFPANADLQRQLERAAATNVLLITKTPSLTRNGFVGGVRVELAYQLTPTMSLGTALRYDQAPQFNETNVIVKLTNKF